MKNNIVSYETALLLKQKGFNQSTEFYYRQRETSLHMVSSTLKNKNLGEGDCSAPTINELRQWLADEHEIYIELVYNFRKQKQKDHCYRWGAIMEKKHIYKVAENCNGWNESLKEAVETIVRDYL